MKVKMYKIEVQRLGKDIRPFTACIVDANCVHGKVQEVADYYKNASDCLLKIYTTPVWVPWEEWFVRSH